MPQLYGRRPVAAIRILRSNPIAGLLQSSGTLHTTGKNYVRDNDRGDNFGVTADSLL